MQITNALDVVHRRGIIHRGIKPESLFVIRPADGCPAQAKVLDFGLAKGAPRARDRGSHRA
jgi:serine/threonine protein kinase